LSGVGVRQPGLDTSLPSYSTDLPIEAKSPSVIQKAGPPSGPALFSLWIKVAIKGLRTRA
jgi:hypothetical protein